MADEVKVFHYFGCVLVLFLCGQSADASIPSKCLLVVEGTNYMITNWTWTVVNGTSVYYINICSKQQVITSAICSESSVCSTNVDGAAGSVQNIGSASSRQKNKTEDGTGFTLAYTGGSCSKGSNVKWSARILVKCGKILGAPEYIEESVSSKGCEILFEFVTNEACKKTPKEVEIPCSLYGKSDHFLRDLSPLIKLKGGYEVATSNSQFGFHINVCRGITAEKVGHTSGCPGNSSICRIDKNLQTKEDVGSIILASTLELTPKNEIRLRYETSQKPAGCLVNPVTTITFVCPEEFHQSGDKGPELTADNNCVYEILWETEFACHKSNLMSNNSCVLSNEFVNFDLSKLMLNHGNYMVNDTVLENNGKLTNYGYYINICKSTDLPCAGINSSVCQVEIDGKVRRSLGDTSTQKLRYADGQLILTYQGGTQCSSGLRRSTVITFTCDYHSGIGKPVFSYEDYCLYFFDWKTKYACPPSRRTGTHCRVQSDSGVRYDLSELVRFKSPNWLALDGESSSSDRQIYINVCGQLNFNADTTKCDRAAAVCIITKSTGKATSLGKYTDPPTLNPDHSIKLEYMNGDECRKDSQGQSVYTRSTVTFVCQPGDLESPPVLVSHSQDNCHFQLMWKSAAACSLGVTTGSDCKVEDKVAGFVFDLGPLARKTWNGSDFYPIKYKDSNTEYEFQLKICGGSNKTACPGNVGSCQVDTKGKHNWTLGEPNDMLFYYDGMINLTYPNGEKCKNDVKRTSHVTFLCDENASDGGIGVPEYEKENHCIYNFKWFTKYACPSKVTECMARSDLDQYDLSSLVKTQDNWKTSSSVGGGDSSGTFYINVCRSLNLSPTVSGCSGTAAVCLKKLDGTAVNLGEVTDRPQVLEKDSIIITYSNGDNTCKTDKGMQHYKTNITLTCDNGETSSSPIYDGKVGCTYNFHWPTAAACAIENKVGSNCAVNDPKSDTIFNLLPLMKKPNGKPYNLTDGKGGTFLLNICGTVPAADCNGEKNAGACQIESGSGKTILLGEMSKELGYKGEILTLSYLNGYNYAAPGSGSGRKREVHIKFYCNPKKPFGEPAFTVQEDQKLYFDFQTSLACPASAVQCMLTQNKKTYDLSPLGLTKGNWEAIDVRPQNKHLHYYINICRSVNPTSEQVRCPGGGIGACQVDHNSGKGFSLGSIQSDPTVATTGELTLLYLGGSECHHQFNRSTRIIFSCSKTMGSPIFVAETPECEYVFSWETPSACPLTREKGTHCKVEDKQYDYMFDVSRLYNKTQDYNVSVRGAPGERILLNVCNKLVNTKLCAGDSNGACIIKKDKKPIGAVVNSNLSYFNEQIDLTYTSAGSPSSVVNIIFECNRGYNGTDTGLMCDKKNNSYYECRWQTSIACRPMNHVQCSIRNEDGSVDKQYDFSPLSKSVSNWQARITGPNKKQVSYFINVCRPVLTQAGAASCPPTAGVCMVTGTTSSYVNLGSVTSGPQKKGNSIYLVYENGDKCPNGKRYSTNIQMECGQTEGEPLYVTMSEQTCTYEFLWITSTACPVNTKNETVLDNCRAINPQTGVVFDLSPLTREMGSYVVRDQAGRNYSLNVCGPLNDPPTGCGKTSGVCQVGEKTFNAGNSNKRLHFEDGVVYLNYSGGEACHHVKKKRETIISFVCNSTHGSSDNGKPVFISESDDCTYYILWHTPLVCERQFECAAFKKGADGYTLKYSLSRLMKSDVNWVVSSLTGETYYINLCRPLLPIPNVLCPAGSWACKVSSSGKPQSFGQATKPVEVSNNGELHLVYRSNTKCKVAAYYELQFTFTCAYGSLGNPVIEEEAVKGSCVTHISWATSAACPDVQKPDLEHCRVFDNATAAYYDLSSLKNSSQGASFFDVKEGNGHPEFYVSVCRGMELSGDSSKPCDRAGVCMITNENKKKTYRPLGLYKNWNMTFYRDERMMIINCCNDECDKANVTSKIIFVCDEKTASGKPELETYGKYGADFVWKTSLVCPPVEQECVYKEGSNTYDLQLLSSRTNSWHYISEKGKDRFWINICRGIRDGPKGCPASASVCLQREGSDTVSVIGFTSTQRISRDSDDGFLLLSYSGVPPVEKCTEGSKPKVTIKFKCGSHVGQPLIISSSWSACSFIFEWKSKVACKLKKETLQESSQCVVKNPDTMETVDFNRLHHGANSRTWNVVGEDETVHYFINVCGSLDQHESAVPPSCKNKDKSGICLKGEFLAINNRKMYYEDLVFSLWLTTDQVCSKQNTAVHVVVIHFQCSLGEVGSPKFEYTSSNCHHIFTWPTSVVCSGDLSHTVTDPPVAHKKEKSSTKSGLGIAFGVVAFVVVILVFAVVLYKPSRRHSLVSCIRWNFKRHILRHEIKSPVYKYQKLNAAGDDDEADALLREAEEDSDEDNDDDDDDMLAF